MDSCDTSPATSDSGRDVPTRTVRIIGNTVDSSELMQQHNLLTIQHGSERYLLRLTRANKLILTK